ncbi:hypothetical protein G5B38_20035 (plasmid) [Pseudohalocynthiibacter aestuariivivens]|uniref:CDP-glycerol glycerophosphotransferase family protein n=1 Tax=Roseovarius pelagicus TaxID=2980108 RepID=A0ABY6D660_9RHOB|nr:MULTISPECIES: hypothetical protein [Rhodobacterales]QIE47906.1 hypothetical protein G5B38_20035 [Pseudohalocynthiibacter aestuariivivens]UXX81399.1 CDP-glycerol glycerophosphotransferase family protein [Roseovarius pelagicus]
MILSKFLRVLLLAPVAFLVARLRPAGDPFVMIATRDAHIGPCSLQLIQMVCADPDRQLVLSVRNRAAFDEINQSLITTGGFKIMDIVEQDSFKSLCRVFQANVHIAFENVFETFIFANRLGVWSGKRPKPVLVPDGIVTKTNGSLLSSDKIVGTGLKVWLVGRAAKRITYVSQSGADNYRTCLNTGIRSPSLMRPRGLPRFMRAAALKSENTQPLLTPHFREMLAEDTARFRIMVALTKNKEASDLVYLLKQMNMTLLDLNTLLAEADTSLWIKSHQSTLPLDDADTTVGNQGPKRIFAVGTPDGLSSVDLFPSFDGLLTDISSIYVDFLPFEGHIGFVSYDTWKAEGRFCYPDSPFYPGAKLNTVDDLRAFLEGLSKQDPIMQQERDYARRVLLGDGTDSDYWAALLAS